MRRVSSPRWRTWVDRHRPLAILLPASLLVAWPLALLHGGAVVPPANQGLLADPLTELAASPAWRVLWSLWLPAALIIVESLGRRFRMSDATILAIGAVLIAAPVSLWAAGWAGTDGPLIFIGVLSLWLACRFADGRGSGWWLVLCGLAAGVLGVAAVLAFLLALILLAGVAAVQRAGGLRLIGVGALAVIASLVLPAIAAALRIGPTSGTPVALEDGSIGALSLLRRLLDAMIVTGLDAVASRGGPPGLPDYLTQPIGWVLIAGVLVAFAQARRSRPEAPLAVAAAVTALLAGPVLVLVLRLLHGDWLLPHASGSAVLLPAFLLATGTVLGNRVAAWVVVGWSGLVAVLAVLVVAGAG